MSEEITYPYNPDLKVDGVDDVEADDNNRKEEQLEALTFSVYRVEDMIAIGTEAEEVGPGVTFGVLTTRVLNTAVNNKWTMGGSVLANFSAKNVVGPVGTGVSTFVQRFTVPTLLLMGADVTPGAKTKMKVRLYEYDAAINPKVVGEIDVTVVAP